MWLPAVAIAAGLNLGQLSQPVAVQDAGPVAVQPQPGQQEQPPAETDPKKPPTPEHTGLRALFRNLGDDFSHLPAKDNAYLALLGGGLAAIAHPADATFNAHLRSHDPLVNNVYKPAKYLGDTPEQVGLSLGTYAYGRLFDAPKVSHLGMDLLRAQILTEAMVEPIKLATHRTRPDLSNSMSFPSGHAAVTFAAATVIERHLGWRKSLFGYAIASYVASSRLHDNRHYLSDVVFGAAVGTIAGRTVMQHGRDTWTVAPVNVPGGVAILAYRTR
jgi:membrane-associated phospholipid phosphatase